MIRNSLILFFLLIAWIACKQPARPEPPSLSDTQIDSLVQVGIDAYGSNPREAIAIFLKAGKAYEQNKNYDKAGAIYLNIAVIYEENTQFIDSAEIYALRSLENFRHGIDSIQIMNVTKYYGFLIGTNGQINEGRKHLNDAFLFYSRHDNQGGLAVTKFNLARVAYKSREFDQANQMLFEAKAYWYSEQNGLRVLLAEMLEMEVAAAMGDQAKVKKLITHADSIMDANTFPVVLQRRYDQLKQSLEVN